MTVWANTSPTGERLDELLGRRLGHGGGGSRVRRPDAPGASPGAPGRFLYRHNRGASVFNIIGTAFAVLVALRDDEWRTMRHGRESELVQRWLDELDRSSERLVLRDEKQSVAYAHWFEQTSQRQEGRRGRIAEARPVVPRPIWFVLILGALLVVAYMLLFADPSEPFLIQAAMIGVLTPMLVSSPLVVHFLDRPYENRSGSI